MQQINSNGRLRRERTLAQRLADRVVMTDMYLRGFSQEEIAQKISAERPYTISTRLVNTDLYRMYKEWREKYLKNIDDLKQQELARIDHLEKEYWDAWDESRKKKTEIQSERIEDKSEGRTGAIGQKYNRTKVKKRETQRDGDARFLDGIQWCISQRVKILGLEAAQRVEVDWVTQAKQAGIAEPAELFNELVAGYYKELSRNGMASRDEPEGPGGSQAPS